jgi:hypothetical protein
MRGSAQRRLQPMSLLVLCRHPLRRESYTAFASPLVAFCGLATFQQCCEAQNGPRDKLAGLQKRLKSAAEGHVELSLSLYASGHGMAVKQPAMGVTIAWKRPTFYYVYEPQFVKNPAPACWYWLEDGGLQVFQCWQKGQPYRDAQARAVQVANFSKLAGDGKETAFCLAKETATDFAFLGGTGAAFLDVLVESKPNAMTTEKREGYWRLREKASEFKNLMVRESLLDDKANAYVVFDIVDGDNPIKAISVYPDVKTFPDYSESAKFDRIGFTFRRESLKFPEKNIIAKRVELKEKSDIRVEILSSIRPRPVTLEKKD